LSCVQQGSKILFTTRMESVANLLASVIDKDHESLSLEGLEKQQLRLLFNDYAFRGVKNKILTIIEIMSSKKKS
jgi:hypothetical protein